jgi:hypothetical protein
LAIICPVAFVLSYRKTKTRLKLVSLPICSFLSLDFYIKRKIRNKQKRKHISKNSTATHTEVALCTQQYHTIQFRSTIIELIVSLEIQGATRPPARQHRHRLTTPIIAHTLCQQASYP